MDVRTIISKLTLEEKALLLQGKSTWETQDIARLGIPSMFLSDGPHGLRKQAGASDHLGLNASIPATCFPTSATMANSWDVALGEELGNALGEEAAANDVHAVLGPGLNMKRSPLCGRNFEYFSEDPYLAGKMAAAYVRGIQKHGVAACPKHYAVNSQEMRRMAMDSVVDERTLREVYLTGFEIAVREGGAKSIMSAYNRVNGEYANESRHLLKEILRDEWGFDGFVVTDWGGSNDHTEGVRCGSALEMPNPGVDSAMGLVESVRAGKIEEKILDERLEELLRVVLDTTQCVAQAKKNVDTQAHHEVARKCAAESIVLLENDGILPLVAGTKVVLIGDFARVPRYQGAGSSVVNPTKLENLVDCMPESGLELVGFARGYTRTGAPEEPGLQQEAIELAKKAQTVLMCIGLDEISESEGLDRTHLKMPDAQVELLKVVYAVNPNVVWIVSGGSAFQLPQEGYRAIVHGYLGGQAGASAMLDVITGRVNPSGKLAETWPLTLESCASSSYFPAKERTSEYREGPYIEYRYFDTVGEPVRYPFGYGLSYTTFAYSDLHAQADEVSFTLANTGLRDGAEVLQVYVGCKNGKVFRPAKELKGFAKVFLKAGEQKRVKIPLDNKAFRYYNVLTHAWEVEGGEYEIMVASSVSDVRLSAAVKLQGTGAPLPYGSFPAYESGRVTDVSDEEFERLLGRSIPDGRWSGEIQMNDAICQLYYAKSPVARFAYRVINGRKERAEAKGVPDLNTLFIYNMPLRALAKMTGGMISMRMVEDILHVVNGHFFSGMGRLIADFVRNRRESAAWMRRFEKREGEKNA